MKDFDSSDKKMENVLFWIFGWFLSVLTMIGNGLVILLVCGRRQLRTETNAFIASLAVADFCVGISAIPLQFFCILANGCKNRPTTSISYLSVMFIRVLFQYASGANLCCLMLDRYIAVTKPLKYLTFMTRRRVIRIISLAWGIPLTVITLVASLRFTLNTSLLYKISGWLYACFDIPLCIILIFCFVSMFRIVYKHERAARILAKQLHFNHEVFIKTQGKSTVKMMAVVVALFLLCYIIFARCSFILIINHHNSCEDAVYKLPILVVNSAVNPLSYAIFKRDIRKELKRQMHSIINI
ncbi:octopamine receptor beta-2R-like [Stylophora pistillata]|uniref:octopamine receptor beta-2R-like n=1 Tax=Stylophora pistillata TaxID=50429 RepID=UPI000C03BC77|nr:octopamine receptor beta-2R-like [Stylophora pistillata]